MQDGVRPNGMPLAPIMPFGFYKIFTPGDLDAVVAYLQVGARRSSNEVEPPVYKARDARRHAARRREADVSEADMSDPVKRGFYLVTIGHCMECHTPMANGGDRLRAIRSARAAQEFKGPWGVAVARNITSHKEKGIGAWTDAEIKRAITQGMRKDGTRSSRRWAIRSMPR